MIEKQSLIDFLKAQSHNDRIDITRSLLSTMHVMDQKELIVEEIEYYDRSDLMDLRNRINELIIQSQPPMQYKVLDTLFSVKELKG